VTLHGEMNPQAGLTPQPGEVDRGDFLFWLSVMSTAGDTPSARDGRPERCPQDDSAIRQVKRRGTRTMPSSST
jgi:hypothetical protein